MKKIRLTGHAIEQCAERGTNESEVKEAIEQGAPEPAKHGRTLYRANFQFNSTWQGRFYRIKQVAPVVTEEGEELVVITATRFTFKSLSA